ncbi:MAG: magnesium chelatase subunit D [Hyphomicrobium sp.]
MTEPASSAADAWELAIRAAQCLAVDPAGLGGASIRCRSGVVRDRWMTLFGSLLQPGSPMRRVPLHVTDERLLGGLDLAATLKAGKPIAQSGLLAEADGGVLVLQSAERMPFAAAARVSGAIDRKCVVTQRDGFDSKTSSSFGIISFDESVTDDEGPPPSLLERQAFILDLDVVSHREALVTDADIANIANARAMARRVTIGDDVIEALCAAAIAMGVGSLRASLFAVAAARILAALDARDVVSASDAALAAQLVLAPRATQAPPSNADEPQEQQQPEPPPSSDAPPPDDEQLHEDQLQDMILEAAKAAIPKGLLAALQIEQTRRARGKTAGRAGAKQASVRHGRPVGVRRGELKSGARLNLVETLRAAAVWQPLRRREAALKMVASEDRKRRVEVRKDDFRITRFNNPAETTTIFLVDASGSSALNRLAEAKGAVELLLADCYVRRDQVALIAFRGKSAELLLPPTRSLARAKRSLAGLPGGGGTPLAHGLAAASELADMVRRKGQTPNVIVLTDGRANIARDGAPGRPKAEADALASARVLALAGVSSLVIDTSPHPADQSEKLAKAMAAIYLPLPHADAASLSRAVKAAAFDPAVRRSAGG